MSSVIRVVMFANGAPCPIAGQFLKSMDFEAYQGIGYAIYTDDWREALTFRNAGEAMEFWRTTSKVNPVRPDGKPNRPLTATTVEIIDLSELL